MADYLNNFTETPLHENLSNSEFQVMLMIASGKTVKDITNELSLSVNKTSTNRTRILEKMKTNTGLMFYAVKHELLNNT
ncbi:LuxR C-terminal-related transcriptional regulator, partial [candidate division KSB1 bacterium]